MKKTLIILILLGALLWLLVMPAAVGAYLRTWVPDWLDELGVGDRSQFESGWFASDLTIADALTVDIQARHFPPLGLRWINLGGQLSSPLSDQPFDLHGHLSLQGRSRFDISGPNLAIDGDPRIGAGPVSLQLDQPLDATSTLTADIDQWVIEDTLDNALQTERLEMTLSWLDLDDDHLRLALVLSAAEPADIELQLSAEPVQREALAGLIEGLQQLNQAPPDSTAQQFAMLTVASAWQQLTSAGLVIELDELTLGSENRFTGRWDTNAGQPVVQGQAEQSTFVTNLTPIIGLTAKVPPREAETLLTAWLQALNERGWMTRTGDTLLFSYGASE